MKRYLHDAAVLARKDVLLELRGRETLPAMVLFVVAGLVVFHFAVPTEQSDDVGAGLLWVVILFTALLALVRAFVAEREQRLMDGLLLAPCDRSAIWLGKSLAVLAFLVLTELVAHKSNIVVAGATSSGKTTLLNALAGLLPSGERIITIEDTAELRLHSDHVVRLEARRATVER